MSPPRKTPGHLTFPWYVGSLDGQKCLALQKASNPPPTMCEIVYSNIIILLNTTQGGALREDTKNGCAADKIQPKYLVLRRFVHFNKIVHSKKPTFNGLFKGSQTLQQNSEYRSIYQWTRCACWMRKELWNPFCWNADQCLEHEVKCPGIPWGMGGFGIDWHIIEALSLKDGIHTLKTSPQRLISFTWSFRDVMWVCLVVFFFRKMPFKGSLFQHHLVSLLKHHKFYSDASTCAQRMSNLLKLGSGRHLRLVDSNWDVSLGSWPLVE